MEKQRNARPQYLILLTLACAVVSSILPGNSNAGGLRLGVARIEISDKIPEDQKVPTLVANDVLPQSLERAFERYGVAPLIMTIPVTKAREILAGPISNELFDLLIVPEPTQLGRDLFFALKVVDLRRKTTNDSAQEQIFTAMPDGPGIRGIESGFQSASQRIAAAAVGKTSFDWDTPIARSFEGLVFIWCIVPDQNPGQTEQLLATDLTVSLPFALSQAAKEKGVRANFVGLGPKDYYIECRNQLSGSGQHISRTDTKQVEGTYTISGQLTSSATKDVWLRLFAEDKSVGQTFPLAPIRISEGPIKEPFEILVKRRGEIAASIIESLKSVTQLRR